MHPRHMSDTSEQNPSKYKIPVVSLTFVCFRFVFLENKKSLTDRHTLMCALFTPSHHQSEKDTKDVMA